MRVLTQRFRAIVLGLCSVGIGTLTNSRQLEAQEIEWTLTKLSKLFHGEGGTLADFDGDGSMDIAPQISSIA